MKPNKNQESQDYNDQMQPQEAESKDETLDDAAEVTVEVEDAPADDTDAGEPAATEDEALSKELEEARQQVEELKDKYLRLSAEFDNYRKRTVKEKSELILTGGKDVIKKILPVIDDFERALKNMDENADVNAIKQGVELVYNKFMLILGQNGVKTIETIGKPLDTDYHEAVALVDTDDETKKGKIIDCIETGYTMNEMVIRHAKVVVGK